MKIFTAVALFVFWLVLSASYNPAHLLMGALTAAVVVWLSPASSPRQRRFSWLSVILYMPWLFVRVIKSGFHVSRLILQPGLPIKPALITHKTDLQNDRELVVLGNSITLTPGTITVEVAPGELVVHAIDLVSQKDLLDGSYDEKVSQIFPNKEGNL